MRSSFVVSAVAIALFAACADGGVVGGECRPGACAPPLSQPDAAGDGAADGTAVDGGLPSIWDGAVRDGFGADAEVTADAGASDGCAPPFNTPSSCGDCETQCPAASPICALIDGEYACIPFCTDPLVQCGNECVDLNSDPDHCGSCFNKCPSGICQAGQCVGANTGHIVLACMSFEQSFQGSPQTTLLGNAALLPAKSPVRILAYDQYAAPAAKNKVDQTLSWAANAQNKTFTLTPAKTSAAVVSGLNVIDYDVFVVYEQPAAPAGALETLGNAWFTTLDAFVKAGGVVVVLDGKNGVGEMTALIDSAGLFPVSSETTITGSTLYNNAPIDAIGVNVISPFLAMKETCAFSTTATPGPTTAFVITDSATLGAGNPVVVHRVP